MLRIWYYQTPLKETQVIEAMAFLRTGYALKTAKTQVKIHFVQYLNVNDVFIIELKCLILNCDNS